MDWKGFLVIPVKKRCKMAIKQLTPVIHDHLLWAAMFPISLNSISFYQFCWVFFSRMEIFYLSVILSQLWSPYKFYTRAIILHNQTIHVHCMTYQQHTASSSLDPTSRQQMLYFRCSTRCTDIRRHKTRNNASSLRKDIPHDQSCLALLIVRLWQQLHRFITDFFHLKHAEPTKYNLHLYSWHVRRNASVSIHISILYWRTFFCIVRGVFQKSMEKCYIFFISIRTLMKIVKM